MERAWTFLSGWSFEPLLATAIIVPAILYGVGVWQVNKRFPKQKWPVHYTVLFYSGIASLVIAMLGPFGAYDDTMFWAHMCQHIIMMMLAAPLLLLGQPVLLLLRVSSKDVRNRYVVPVLRSHIVRFFTHPVVSWIFFAGVLVVVHFTGFYNYALDHPWAHNYVEHTLYMFAALCYFYPLLGIGPGASSLKPFAKVVSLFLMMVPEAMVGFALWSATHVLFPHYAGVTDRPWGPGNALDDQRLGGAFMWSSAMIFDVVWICYAAWQWMKAEEVRTRRVDREVAAELAADAKRNATD